MKKIKMNNKGILYCFLFIVLIFSSQSISSQTKTKALLKGIVKDSETKQPLPGATIKVVGTSQGTVTELNGDYSLFTSLDKFEIEVSYLGSKTQIISVEIAQGETKILNIDLEPDATSLDEVMVRGSLDGQQKALSQQKASDNLKNVISSDQMGKFPDQNSAESLQRVSGINVQRDEGDGRFVLVRGLAPQFTNININGEQIPSPEGDSRFVALDAIPANQLASLEVSKSITPEMDGDAIGGSVNLTTPKATKTKLSISGSAGAEYNNSSDGTTGMGNLTISKRSENDKFGFIVSGSYSSSKKHSERYAFDKWDGDLPSGGLDEFEIADYEIERKRIGFNSTLDYKISDKSEIYFRALYSELKEVEQRRRLTLEFEIEDDEDDFGNEIEVPVWTATKELKYRPENQGVYSFNFGGKHTTPLLKIDYEVALSKAFQDTPKNNNIAFENAEDITFDLNTTNRFSPQITNFTSDGNAASISDNGIYEFDGYENEATRAEDKNLTFKTNLTFPLRIGDNTGEIKFGGKMRFKDKDFKVKDFVEYGYEGDDDLYLTAFNDGSTFSGFMDGELDQNIGAFPDLNSWLAFQNANIGDFEDDPAKTLEEETGQEYVASEDVYATYIQGKIKLNKLLILGGFRYEKTNFEYASGQFDEENEVAIPVAGKNQYDFFLPMLHLKYTISDDDIIRASATKSYSRPNFEDLVQGAVINDADKEASIFNPDLVPVEAINLDLFGEHYFGNVGLISGGLFYKKLDNFIYQQTTDRPFNGSIDDYEVTQSVNGKTADLFGFEVGYQQNLSFLPGFLKGIVIYANYTYTDSKAEVENFTEGDGEITEIDLPGQSQHVGNAAIAFNKGGFKARLSLNYNGAYISEFDGGQRVRIDDRKQLDFSMSQTFSKQKFTVFLEMVNLTDERQDELFNIRATPKERQRFGSWGRLGVRFNF